VANLAGGGGGVELVADMPGGKAGGVDSGGVQRGFGRRPTGIRAASRWPRRMANGQGQVA
jgi:hypothetical protein